MINIDLKNECLEPVLLEMVRSAGYQVSSAKARRVCYMGIISRSIGGAEAYAYFSPSQINLFKYQSDLAFRNLLYFGTLQFVPYQLYTSGSFNGSLQMHRIKGSSTDSNDLYRYPAVSSGSGVVLIDETPKTYWDVLFSHLRMTCIDLTPTSDGGNYARIFFTGYEITLR